MRIGLVSTIQGYSWAGTEEVWFHFAKLALQRGHAVMLGADHEVAGSDRVAALKAKGLLVTARRPFRPMRLFLLKQRFLPDMRALRRFRPDVLLVNAGSPLDHLFLPYIWEFCQSLGVPTVFFVHFNSDRLQIGDRAALQASFADLAGMVFVSEANRDLLRRQLAGEPAQRSIVIPNSSRLDLDSPLPWPAGGEPGGGTVRMALVARLETQWKGHDVLLECLAGRRWRDRDWSLSLFGLGPEEGYIRKLIEFYGLQDRVSLSGFVADMTDVWRAHHLLVMPSRGEGMPLAALEAMMCGRPVVATDVGGNVELITEGKSGFIAEAPTALSFGRALERAWQEQLRWPAMGVAAHERARAANASNPPLKLLQFLESIGG